MIAKRDRPERIRELRRQGVALSDIAESLGVSRQTVWRHSKDIEPDPAPAPAPTNGNGHVDLAAAQSESLGVLLDKAKNGSVSAAAHVFKATSNELRLSRCVNHIPMEDVVRALEAQYQLWLSNLKGAFVRRILLEFDVDPARIEGLINDSIDHVTQELNSRFESSEENTHA